MALKFPDILEHNNSNLPLVDITELKGNSYPLGDLSETGSIPTAKRNVGVIVFLTSSQEYYGFYGQTSSSIDWDDEANWRSLSSFSGSISGSFSGSFEGDGSGLTNIQASNVTGLNLSQISTGSISASVSDVDPEYAFKLAVSSTDVFTISQTGQVIANTVIINDDLTVLGTASFQNTENLLVADRFVLFASGSNVAGDGGIVVQQDSQGLGELYGFDSSAKRWGFTGSFDPSTSTYTPEAFVAAVIDIDEGHLDIAKYQKNGNIKVDAGEIWIYA